MERNNDVYDEECDSLNKKKKNKWRIKSFETYKTESKAAVRS